MELLVAVVTALWVALPTYIPNNVAVLAGGGRPIDSGRDWRGARLLGDGKTWRGSLAGIVGGIVIALALNGLNDPVSDAIGIDLPVFPIAIVLMFPLGAILGDMTASFVKRRTGRDRGSAFPIVDQLDFLIMALVLGMIADPQWMLDVFVVPVLVAIVVITPVLHISTNAIAYVLGLKNEPW